MPEKNSPWSEVSGVLGAAGPVNKLKLGTLLRSCKESRPGGGLGLRDMERLKSIVYGRKLDQISHG